MTLARKTVTLALQGGGAHGAFTWGVLDRLLEEEKIGIEGISGTSAGAINAALLADGLEKGGVAGAREALERFWQAMSRYGSLNPYRWGGGGPFAWWLDLLGQALSPYQFNPFDINPLRDALESGIDFERVRCCRRMKLYVSATNVLTNRLRIFTPAELSIDVLLASACLPHLYKAVEIEGAYYWDGGYMGNPVLEPLVEQCEARDIVIVQVNPTLRLDVPRSAEDIVDRVNEISFNSSLMREIRGIASVTRLIEAGVIKDPRYERIFFHRIAGEDVMTGLSARSKLDTSWPFLVRLKGLGRACAERWLAESFEQVGNRSTLDLTAW